MKKLILLFVLIPLGIFGQDKKYSEPSLFIDKTSFVQISSDENKRAFFKSGLGETVLFYASEVKNLKSNETVKGLQIESNYVIGQKGMSPVYFKEIAWLGLDEIKDMLYFFEFYIIPNLNLDAGKNKNETFVFNSKEVMIRFQVEGKNKIFYVILKNSIYPDKYFWTSAKVDDIPKVVTILKEIAN